jgi:hypothetical protein
MRSQAEHAGWGPWHLGATIAAAALAAFALLLPAGAHGGTGLVVPRIAGIVGLPLPTSGTPSPVVAVGATGTAAVAAGDPGVVVAVCHLGVGARVLGLQIGVRADRLVAFLAANPRDYVGACKSGAGLLPAAQVVGSDLLDTLPATTLVRVVTVAGAVLWLSPVDALAYLSLHGGARIGAADDNPPGGSPESGSPAGGGNGKGGGGENDSASGGSSSTARGNASIAAGQVGCGERLIVGGVRMAPLVLRTVGRRVTVDLVVSSERGHRVSNAIVTLRSTPLGRIASTAVKRTGTDGTVRFTVTTTNKLELVRGNRLLLFVRASRPGQPATGCVTGRRLLSIRTAAA